MGSCFTDNYGKGTIVQIAKVEQNFKGRKSVMQKKDTIEKNDIADDAALE